MNEAQDNGAAETHDAETEGAAPETPVAPKRRRAPRKAAETGAPVAEAGAGPGEASPAPVRRRSRAAPRATEVPEGVASAPAEAEHPARPLDESIAEPASPAPAPAFEGEGDTMAQVEVAGGVLSLGAPDEGAAAGPSADATEVAPEMPVAEAAARFEDVLSGQYDAEEGAAELPSVPEALAADAESATGEGAENEPGKRVLQPEAEAPKLHKVLAQSGIGSRRDMEALIESGQVTVNGEVAHLGMRVTYGDQIKVSGKPVRVRFAPGPARVLAYHKPVGEVVTHNDPEGRPTVFRSLPRLHNGRWLSVGRLDLNTEGLLLFTNSGDLANQLMHPRFGVEREYAVRVLGTLDEQSRDLLLEGVTIEGQAASFLSITDGGGEGINHWYRVVIAEGRNREVRKLFDAVGLTVSRLIRIRYGTVVLPRGLKRGVWVELGDNDVRLIKRLAGLDGRGPARGKGRPEAEGERPDRGGRNSRRREGGRTGGGRPLVDEARVDLPPGAEVALPRDDAQGRGPQQRHGKGGRPAPQGPQANPRGPQGGAHGGPQGGGKPGRGGKAGGQPGGGSRERDYEDPMRIPNPLEQTFDRRFATGSKRITTGFGRPMDEPAPGADRGKKGGPKQPDPMQTSVGYIGAEAYFRSPALGKGRGRRR